ncbi:MAG: diacylglycerol kinase [Sphingomonadales bacterium]|nr:diacylglycerol kinase [Sphingomonadales bacterium]
MFDGKAIWLAVNAASGSNSDAGMAALERAFGDAACTIVRRIGFHEEGAPRLDELRDEAVDILVVFTGDGTANTIITELYGWEGAILVLPGGTMNILAHRLHGDAQAADVVAWVAAGAARRVRPTVVRSRHGDGLSGVLAGPGTAWAPVREALRENDMLGTIAGAADAIGESTAGPKVHCREPAWGREEGYSAIQLVPRADGFAVEGYYAETLGDYAKQGIALLRRNFREGPHDALGCHDRVRLACPEGEAMGLLIDGEPYDAGNEEWFTLARCEVDLLATVDHD